MLLKYRDKRKQEECMQYTGNNFQDIKDWAGDYCFMNNSGTVIIQDHFRLSYVCNEGDFVIYDSNDGFAVISKATFLTDFCTIDREINSNSLTEIMKEIHAVRCGICKYKQSDEICKEYQINCYAGCHYKGYGKFEIHDDILKSIKNILEE